MKKNQFVSGLHFIFFILISFGQMAFANNIWVIAIDPGHGGTDPGAISRNLKIYEKNVTLSIANELKALLDKDANFRGVLTRKGDYFISVPKRSEIARQHKANLLISIHADSNVSSRLRGASVWILSNRRANSEMGKWLEDHEKHSQLLGGAGNVLSSHSEKYLDQTVLDLQFGHSQRVGYELGSIVLRHFSKITALNRNIPQHASLGVLRSPDIPSILVETGFLSNPEEEKKLNTLAYRKKVAYMIYQGLSEYRKKVDKAERAQRVTSNVEKTNTNENEIKDSGLRHKVVAGESLTGLAKKYKVTINAIVQLNKLKNRNLFIDQTLKIPQGSDINRDKKQGISNKHMSDKKSPVQTTKKMETVPQYHVVKKGQTLYAIAREYNLPPSQLLKLNPNLKNGKVLLGQKLKLRE
ncbi:LysM peptidoglycan-binding domain-containing protein [[Haemophilus] felis]|uniref:N-acetylmuramoyl-L-alanine amidase n=1 Tax=[Haemophilus] felis TaxID=123822 RepID=A0A1T0B1V7_9PAST|nr:LysM peptidoglycan-binding domain-containing protein [[Haemophilus] felis]NBI40246.1 LysM peptidoglycan-binding domain-containing protein [[Haemophilus] felis]OOS04087.1 N-acetylmuramoyl-L-alanine amidase [[Haemophilus] felis]